MGKKHEERNESVVMLGSMARLLGVLLDPAPPIVMPPMRNNRLPRSSRPDRDRYITDRLNEINDRLDDLSGGILSWDRQEKAELLAEKERLEEKL